MDWAWENGHGRLVTGTDQEKPQPAMKPAPLDVNPWSILALQDKAGEFQPGLDWGVSECSSKTTDGIEGFRFSTQTSADQIWPEGSAHMALAYKALGRVPEAKSSTSTS